MDDQWIPEPERTESSKELEREHREQMQWLSEATERMMRLCPRKDLLKLRAQNLNFAVMCMLIDDHLANRFWKGCDVPGEEGSERNDESTEGNSSRAR